MAAPRSVPVPRAAWPFAAALCAAMLGGRVGAEELPQPSLGAGTALLQERHLAVGQLVDWLSARDTRGSWDWSAAAAMLALGRLRAREAIPVLAEHHSFYSASFGQIRPSDFPALLSLAAIGLPAMPSLTGIAAEGWGGGPVNIPLQHCLCTMAHGRMIRQMVLQAADREADPARAQRLRETARYVGGRGSLQPPRSLIVFRLAELQTTIVEALDPRVAEAIAIAERCEAAAKDLSDWLVSLDAIQQESRETQGAAVAAMELLGKFRLPEGIPGLKKHWSFVRPGEDGRELEDYPALTAIMEIDLPAFEALVEIAVEGHEGKAITWPLTEVFAKMGPADAVAEVIERHADREIDPDRYKRLMETAAAVREGRDESQ